MIKPAGTEGDTKKDGGEREDRESNETEVTGKKDKKVGMKEKKEVKLLVLIV